MLVDYSMTWDYYEGRCLRAREALLNFPARKDLEEKGRLKNEYNKVLKELQNYLTNRYGWGPRPNIQ